MTKYLKFEDLPIWQKARELCKIIYQLTSKGNFIHDYKFKEQWRSSSGSVMDCIAEGYERDGNKEYINFLSIAKGSCGEVRSQAYRAFDANHITQEEFADVYNRATVISQELKNFMVYLKNSEFKGTKFM